MIQTITPGLDFDYIVENLFGLGSEGRGVQGLDNIAQGLIWIHKMKGPFFLGAPVWIQYVLALMASAAKSGSADFLARNALPDNMVVAMFSGKSRKH